MGISPLGHSWPSLNWWLSLTAADQGAWISGIGSLAAAAVAVVIAGSERRHRRAAERSQQALADYRICVQLEPVFQDLFWVGEHLLEQLREMEPGQKSQADLRQQLRLATFRAAAELNIVSENISRALAVHVLACIGRSRKIAAAIESAVTMLPPPRPSDDMVLGRVIKMRRRQMVSSFSEDPDVRAALWHDLQVLVYHADKALILIGATIGSDTSTPLFEGPPSHDVAPQTTPDAEATADHAH